MDILTPYLLMITLEKVMITLKRFCFDECNNFFHGKYFFTESINEPTFMKYSVKYLMDGD
jgi:hypothetical protein